MSRSRGVAAGSAFAWLRWGRKVVLGSAKLSPSDEPPGGGPGGLPSGGPSTAGREDLPYKVEVWDANQEWVEQVLAVTASASIGYAAYFAATREFPNRVITLRHKNSVISRWNGPPH